MNDLVQKHMTDRNVQIGNICVQWAHLELLLAQAIWAARELDEKSGSVETANLNIKERAQAALAECKKQSKPDNICDALQRICKSFKMGDIIDRRNQAIHGHRFSDPDDPAAEIVVMHRGEIAGKRVKRRDAELAQLGRDISDLHKPLMEALTSNGMTI